MTTYNTGNPLGSSDPRDLYDNAENLDEAVNSDGGTFQDRLGKSRLTWAGMENQFDADQTSREQQFRTFIASSGYQFAGDYAAGIEITQYNQLVRDENGEFWRVSGRVDLPYVTSGEGLPEADALVPAGDAVLRQDLANPNMGAAMVASNVRVGDSIDRDVRDKVSDIISSRDYADLASAIDSAGTQGLNIAAGTYEVVAPITPPVNYFTVKGVGRGSKITYTGEDSRAVFDLDRLGDGSSAYLNSQLGSFVMDGGMKSFSKGALNVVYNSRNSYIHDIDILGVGGGAAVRLAKNWYIELSRIRCLAAGNIRTPGTTGVLIDGEEGQNNDVLFEKLSVNSFENGVHLKMARENGAPTAINGMTFIVPTIENCTRGVYLTPGGELPMMNVYGGYFEGNDWDIYFEENPTIGRGMNINWSGVYFAVGSGRLYLGSGTHVFTSCWGISEVTVGPQARVFINGNAGVSPSVTYLPGADRNNIIVNIRPSSTSNDTNYGGNFARSDLAASRRILSGTVSEVRVPFPTELLRPSPATGRVVHVMINMRRAYQSTSPGFYEFTLTENTSGTWGLANVGRDIPAGTTIDVDTSTGDLIVSWSAGDTKVIDIKFSPF